MTDLQVDALALRIRLHYGVGELLTTAIFKPLHLFFRHDECAIIQLLQDILLVLLVHGLEQRVLPSLGVEVVVD